MISIKKPNSITVSQPITAGINLIDALGYNIQCFSVIIYNSYKNSFI